VENPFQGFSRKRFNGFSAMKNLSEFSKKTFSGSKYVLCEKPLRAF
jgi:hypothetical protein